MKKDPKIKEATKLFSHARMLAVRKAPFMADMIYMLVPHPAPDRLPPGTGTAVTAKGHLLYHPEIFVGWSNEDRATAIVHEAEHLRRDHHGRFAALNKPGARRAWNAAADAELNDDLEAMRFKMLDTDIMPKDLEMPNGRLAEEYFKLGGGSAAMRGVGKKGRGECGSGAGNPLADEGDLPALNGRRDQQLQAARVKVAHAAVEQARMRPGTVPDSILREAAELLTPPTVPWEHLLQRACSRASALRAGMVDLSYSRVSRRQCALGFGPGVPIVRSFVSPIPRVTFIQDTSMSMGASMFAAALAQADQLLRTIPNLTYISNDAAVHLVKKNVRSASTIAANLIGGGGTDFRPAFLECAKMRPRPDIIVFSTDLEGTFPAVKPSWAHVIWLITSIRAEPPPTPWGTRIRIPIK